MPDHVYVMSINRLHAGIDVSLYRTFEGVKQAFVKYIHEYQMTNDPDYREYVNENEVSSTFITESTICIVGIADDELIGDHRIETPDHDDVEEITIRVTQLLP
jgi:hypothetical protein